MGRRTRLLVRVVDNFDGPTQASPPVAHCVRRRREGDVRTCMS